MSMTLGGFIYKYLGKKVDYDGYYGGQCVDLYRQYVKEVLEYPQSPGVGGAAEIWHSADPKYYDFIKDGNPKIGDIVIWNRKVGGGFGHVAIFISGTIKDFTSLDQNWPTLSKVTTTKHNNKNITGWLHPKKDNSMSKALKHFKVKTEEELIEMVDKQLEFLKDARKKIKTLEGEIVTKNNSIAGNKGEVTKLQKKITQLESNKPSTMERLTSRKWISSFAGIVALLVSRLFNIELNPAEVAIVITPILGFITAEGVKDYKVSMLRTANGG